MTDARECGRVPAGGEGVLTLQTLVIQHVANSTPPGFLIARHDPHKATSTPACVAPPDAFDVPGLGPGRFRPELRWYLEQFLDYPFPPATERADAAAGMKIVASDTPPRFVPLTPLVWGANELTANGRVCSVRGEGLGPKEPAFGVPGVGRAVSDR